MPVLERPVRKQDWIHEISTRNGFSAARAHTALLDAGPWESAVRTIVGLQDLGDNWDGYGAKPPRAELLQSALGLAYLLCEKGVDPPQSVVPGVDGSVNFEWRALDGTLTHLEIDRPLHAEVMLLAPGKPAEFWELPTD